MKKHAYLLICLSTLICLAAVFVGMIAISNPELKRSPEISRISITPPPQAPASKELQRFLKEKAGPVHPPWLPRLLKLASEGHWGNQALLNAKKFKPKQHTLQQAMATIIHPQAIHFRKIILGTTCLPFSTKPSDPHRFMRLIGGLHSFLIDVWWRASFTAPQKAADDLLSLYKKYQDIEHTCSSHLVLTMIMLASFSRFHDFIALILVHPHVSHDTKRKLLQALSSWAARKPDSLIRALQWEAVLMKGILKEQMALGMAKHFGSVVPKVWPWWDEKETMSLLEHNNKLSIYQATQHPGQSSFWKVFPEQHAMSRLVSRSGFKSLFTYNALGKLLVSIARPQFTRYILRWYRLQCTAAFMNFRYRALLKKQGVSLSKLAQPIQHPITREAFSLSQQLYCRISSPQGSQNNGFKALKVPVLPAPPTTTLKKKSTP